MNTLFVIILWTAIVFFAGRHSRDDEVKELNLLAETLLYGLAEIETDMTGRILPPEWDNTSDNDVTEGRYE